MDKEYCELRDRASKILQEKNIPFSSENLKKIQYYNDLMMCSHNQMVQGPWQRLGIAVDKLISDVIEDQLFRNEEKFPCNYNYEMSIDTAFSTAKELTTSFFDSFEKEFQQYGKNFFRQIIDLYEDEDQ